MGEKKIFKNKLNAEWQSKHNSLEVGGLVNPPYFKNPSKILITTRVKSICTITLIVLFLSTTFAYAEENKSLEHKSPSIRTTPFQSLINKFKKKPKNTIEMENKSPESNILTLKGSLSMTLTDCEDYMVKHNPTLKIYTDTQQAQKSLVGQAKSSYFPTFYGGTGYNIMGTSNNGGSQEGYQNGNFYGINAGISQLIWDFGRTTANINMNKYSYEAAGYDLIYQTAVTTYNVRLDYTAVLAARANEDIEGLLVKIQELNYQRTKAMFDVGLKSKIDVVNAQYNLTQAKVALLEAQNKYQTALITLNNAMYFVDAPDYSIKDTETFNFQKNYAVKNELDVADRKNYDTNSVNAEIKDGAILTSEIEKRDIIKTYKFKPYTRSLTDSIKIAYDNRPDLKSSQLLVKVQEESLKAVKRSFYPQINASALYNFGNYSDYNSNKMGIYAGVDLPNINGMYIKYQIEQGKALLDRAINYEDLAKKNIYFQIQTDYVNMKKLEKEIPLMSDEVKQSFENFELADGRYAVGLGDYIELQTALANYNNSQLAFVQTVFDYNQARFYLTRDMGIMQDS